MIIKIYKQKFDNGFCTNSTMSKHEVNSIQEAIDLAGKGDSELWTRNGDHLIHDTRKSKIRILFVDGVPL